MYRKIPLKEDDDTPHNIFDEEYEKVLRVRDQFRQLQRVSATMKRIKDEIGSSKGDYVRIPKIILQRLDNIPHHFGACLIFDHFNLIISVFIRETYPFSAPTFELYKIISKTDKKMNGESESIIVKACKLASVGWRPNMTILEILSSIYICVDAEQFTLEMANDSNNKDDKKDDDSAAKRVSYSKNTMVCLSLHIL